MDIEVHIVSAITDAAASSLQSLLLRVHKVGNEPFHVEIVIDAEREDLGHAPPNRF